MQKLSFDVDAYVDTVSLEEVGQAAVQDIEVVTVALAREGKEAKRTMTAPVPIVHSRAHVDQTLRFTVTLYRSATGAWEEKVYRVMVEAKDFKGAVNVLGSADLNIPDHVAEKAPSSPLVLHVPQCGEVKIVLRVQAHVEGEAEVAQRRGSDELKLAAHHHAAAAAHAEEHNHHASGGYDHQTGADDVDRDMREMTLNPDGYGAYGAHHDHDHHGSGDHHHHSHHGGNGDAGYSAVDSGAADGGHHHHD